MRVSVCLGAILIPEYLDFYSGYSAPRSRIAGIFSGIYSYSGISQTNASLVCLFTSFLNRILEIKNGSEISSLLYALRAAIYSLFLPYSTIWRNVLIHWWRISHKGGRSCSRLMEEEISDIAKRERVFLSDFTEPPNIDHCCLVAACLVKRKVFVLLKSVWAL